MNITHHMYLRARPGRSALLGHCLQRLPAQVGSGRLRIWQMPEDGALWCLQGQWPTPVLRDGFLASERLERLLAELLAQDILASLHYADESLRSCA